MADDELTPRQVAAELGVTVRTVQRWIAAGRLPAIRVGSRLRVSRSSLGRKVRAERAPTGARPIRTLLIANRGEIAERIARTARRLGMRVVGLATPDDSPVASLDALVAVGDYLDRDAVLEAAVRAGADAVHPGYGFLSENPAFAAAVEGAGLAWVGPPAAAIAAMGDKAAARRTAVRHGVPVVPGYDGEAQDDPALLAAARQVGYPLVVKPAAGGGGKGMRTVRSADALGPALAAARREARRSFGDDRVLLERLVEHARHVEIQVLFDGFGAGVHLGERDCSAQRRNQKVVEESPGPSVGAGLRDRMGAAALAVAAGVGYRSAGTVEFLVDDGGDFWFLEMNTRLQVEHPVTELVTGRDLVEDQLRIAGGEPLGVAQAAIAWRGHAIEARIYAEDPEAGFLPATGRLLAVAWPEGVRVDAGVAEGTEVGDRYDPMLAKIIAHGTTRAEALDRLRAALAETRLVGVRTNLRFLRWLVDRPEMRDGQVRTDTIEGMSLPAPAVPDDAAWSAAGAALAANDPRGAWGGGWRSAAPAAIRLRCGDAERRVELGRATPHDVVVVDGVVHLDVEGQSLEIRVAAPPSVEEAVRHAAAGGAGQASLRAPMPGRVVAVRVVAGDIVREHEIVVIIEAMKMEHAVVAPMAGTVIEVAVAEGTQVRRGDLLAQVSA